MEHMPPSVSAINLLAIFLITRSRSGSSLVFHHPACPATPVKPHELPVDSDLDTDSDDDREKDGKSLEHDKSLEQPHDSNFEQQLRDDEGFARDPRHFAASQRVTVPASAEEIFGYSVESLEAFLSPGRWSDAKRFEVEFHDITFVGHPIFAAVDGTWSEPENATASTKPDRRVQVSDDRVDDATTRNPDELSGPSEKMAHPSIAVHATANFARRDFTHIPESLDSQRGTSLATSMNSASTTSGVLMEQMTMFNIVIACSSEAQNRASDLHQHIVQIISKALHYCQQQSNYVGAESRKLSALKMKAKQDRLGTEGLSAHLLEGSELAWALAEVFEKTRIGEIASVRLSGMDLSLQMPFQHAHLLPDRAILSPNTGLLLLESKEVLLRELNHPEALPLAHFIREHTPTKSLQKHATNLSLPLDAVLSLAQHLIKWRKARATAPLHQRNFYVAASDAPLDQVTQRAPGLLRRFPALPSLPRMLQMLSGRPIKYGLLIPSRDHRQAYMDLLAYLLRDGFVVQLKTSGWLKMPKDINKVPAVHESKRSSRTITTASLLSPYLQNLDDDNASISSEQTAIPPPSNTNMQNRSRHSSDESRLTEFDGTVKAAPVICNPSEPSHEEVRALEFIRSTIRDAELRDNFPSLLRFFDGEHVLEEIASHKGMKRAKIEGWLEILSQAGHLMTFRHL